MSIGIVETAHGKVRGVLLEGKYRGITLFKGIPYAAPPLGPLRWKPPAEPKGWNGILACDTYGPPPVQIFVEDAPPARVTGREYHYLPDPPMSEDCLYLNVCTGASGADEKRPVYFWLHGGGLVNGYAYEVEFNPSELARKGIVVVQVGHRLNVFGFLALPQITAEQGISGNYGLLDILKALDWVRGNISAFGGDPENITVGGESGGCLKACALAASPASRGKIRRVINQSGNMWLRPQPTLAEAEKKGRAYMESAGIEPDASLEELRSLPADRIFTGRVPRELTPNDMVIGGNILPASLRDCFDRNLDGVDFLNGSNFGESEVFGKPWWLCDRRMETTTDFYGYYRELLKDLYDKYDFPELVKVSDRDAWRTARRMAALGLGPGYNHNRNLMVNRIFGMYMSRRYPGSRVYSYIWSHFPPFLPEDKGTDFDPEKLLAYHSSELWFAFASLRAGVPPCRPWRPSDYRLADTVSSYWVNFIRTGDPNGPGLPDWPASGDNYGYIDLDDECRGDKGADSPLDSLIREYVYKEYGIS